MKGQLNSSIKQFLLYNPLADSYFIFHRNMTLFLLKKKNHRIYYLRKSRKDIYPVVHFMWKWAKQKRKFCLYFLCTTVIIVTHTVFRIIPSISECTCVFYSVHPTYLFYTSHSSSNPTAVSVGAESQIFHFWTSQHCVKSVQIRSFSDPYFPALGLDMERYGLLRIQSECGKIGTRKNSEFRHFSRSAKLVFSKSTNLLLHIRKNIFHENANAFETGPVMISMKKEWIFFGWEI